jgi:hypothetical protein
LSLEEGEEGACPFCQPDFVMVEHFWIGVAGHIRFLAVG